MSNNTSESNVVTKEDLKVLEERIFFYENSKKIGTVDKMIPRAVKENEAIKHLLAEREQKNKRIQELEELVAKFKTVDYMFRIDSYSNRYDMRRIYFEWLDSIPKQVVVEVLQNNRNELFGMTCLSKEQYRPYEMQIERINKIEKELLEGERK